MPTERRRLAAMLAGALLAVSVQAKERTGWDLDALLVALAARQQGTARFTETRTFKVVTRPLHSSGLLRFRKPDLLEKETLSPRPERMRVDGDRVTIDDGGPDGPKVLHLSEHPEVRILIESIRAPLTGNRDKLDALFRTSFGGTERRWLLSLVPREPHAAEWVRAVYVRGSGDRVTAVEVEERSGDRSVLRIEPMP